MSQQTHVLAFWTEADRGTVEECLALERVVQRFEAGLDELFFGWLVDYRAYVMHGLLVFRCEVRARGRTVVIEESILTELLFHLGGLSVTAATAERELKDLPLRCMRRLAALKMKGCRT